MMSEKTVIRRIDPSTPHLNELAAEAKKHGHSFVERLIQEAKNGKNRFAEKGECFFGVYCGGTLVACGGVNRDPYTDQYVGRLRHIYVMSRARRSGVATLLVKKMLNQCKVDFDTFRLRTPDENADKFYEALGFRRTDEKYATHILSIE